jgi:hypothetical protein
MEDITKTVYHAKGELDQEWSLWERQQSHQYHTDQLNEIICFKDLKHFAKFWRAARHSNISDFLQLEEDTMVKYDLPH